MKKIILFSLFLLVFVSCQKSSPFPQGEWIDLSHDFSEETIYWPTAETFKLKTVYAGETKKGFYYAANNLSAAEHGGTHIDSPIHFAKGKHTVDQIPLEQLIGEAAVIDVSKKALSNPDYQVTVKDFKGWESQHGKLPDGSIVLLKTGYEKFWPDRKKYMGTNELGPQAVPHLHFPGLHPDAALWLVENRKIKAIGLDSPSIDYGQSTLYKSHQILFKENIPAFENVTNMDRLPANGAFVFAFPMKIKGGSGAPLRIVAFLPKK